MGPLRCYAREMIKVEQGWAREVGESGWYVGGFIDDVVGGERLVVDRPVKEFAYFTLRLRRVYFAECITLFLISQAGDSGSP